MNKQNLFATPVWSFMLGNTEELNKNLLKAAPYYTAGRNYFDADNEWVLELRDQVMERIRKVAQECNLSPNFTITGRQNPMVPGQNNSPHHHPDCMLAVVYYVKVSPKSGDILLHDPRGSILWQDPQARTDVTWQSYRPYHKITPVEGQLLIFPGYVIHSVENNLSDELRLSIAISTRFE
jgi:uncharacterized protein (TIGR02466 family)